MSRKTRLPVPCSLHVRGHEDKGLPWHLLEPRVPLVPSDPGLPVLGLPVAGVCLLNNHPPPRQLKESLEGGCNLVSVNTQHSELEFSTPVAAVCPRDVCHMSVW